MMIVMKPHNFLSVTGNTSDQDSGYTNEYTVKTPFRPPSLFHYYPG